MLRPSPQVALHHACGAELSGHHKQDLHASGAHSCGAHAPADAENEAGLTPLHCAALGNSLSVAQLLLDAGADRNATDRGGQTPCEHAPEASEKLRQLLKPSAAAKSLPGAAQATLNGVPTDQQSPAQAFAVSSAAHITHLTGNLLPPVAECKPCGIASLAADRVSLQQMLAWRHKAPHRPSLRGWCQS